MKDKAQQRLLLDLQDELKELYTGVFGMFGEPDVKPVLNLCVEVLRYSGYGVTEPIDFNAGIKNIDDLINYFYVLLSRHHPELVGKRNITDKDRMLARQLVDSRLAIGVDTAEAFKQCACLISIVFEHEDEFHFTTPISFSMFGQGDMVWVTEKALYIMNKEIQAHKLAAYEAKLDKFDEYKNNPNEELGLGNLDDILKNMEDVN